MAIKGQSTTLDQTPRTRFPDGGTGPAGGSASPPVGGAEGVALSDGFGDDGLVALGTGTSGDGETAVVGESPPPPHAVKLKKRARVQRLEEATGFMIPEMTAKGSVPDARRLGGALNDSSLWKGRQLDSHCQTGLDLPLSELFRNP